MAPTFEPATTTNSAPYLNNKGVLGIRRALDQMRSRLLDRQYDFLLRPGRWEPSAGGSVIADLPGLLEGWLGHQNPITILDLSGVPNLVMVRLIGTILRVVYDALFWGREKAEGAIERPLLLVMEEAHSYLAKEVGGPAREMVQRVVKEGRKFGIGAMIVSQRPSEVDETILSQCGTFFALRLSNSADRSKVQSILPDNLSGIVDSLPTLRTGEAIIAGEAARLPIRCRIALPREDRRPNSEDPDVAGRWLLPRRRESYERLTASWRAQTPRWRAISVERRAVPFTEETVEMERVATSSSTVVAVGYDAPTETLEVEFRNGNIYQYYNVPAPVHEQMMQASSIGQYLSANIKGHFSYSQV